MLPKKAGPDIVLDEMVKKICSNFPPPVSLCLDSKNGGSKLAVPSMNLVIPLCLDSKNGGSKLGKFMLWKKCALCLDSKNGGSKLSAEVWVLKP